MDELCSMARSFTGCFVYAKTTVVNNLLFTSSIFGNDITGFMSPCGDKWLLSSCYIQVTPL